MAEHSVLHGMRRELSQHIRLIIHGVNDSTAPPIAIYPIHMQLSGSRGRPKIIVNVELVELLRGCGYTWNGSIADAMQISRATIWRRLKLITMNLPWWNREANLGGISIYDQQQLVFEGCACLQLQS